MLTSNWSSSIRPIFTYPIILFPVLSYSTTSYPISSYFIPLHAMQSIQFYAVPFNSTTFHSTPLYFILLHLTPRHSNVSSLCHYISIHFKISHSIPFHFILFHSISFYSILWARNKGGSRNNDPSDNFPWNFILIRHKKRLINVFSITITQGRKCRYRWRKTDIGVYLCNCWNYLSLKRNRRGALKSTRAITLYYM